MRLFPSHKQSPLLRCTLCCTVFAGLMLFGVSGCRKSVRTRDSQLRPVQELLDVQLPPGTPEDKVKAFLEQRGCVVLPSQKPGTVVALIPTMDNRDNPPIAARVTFYFDANGKLNTFALARASGEDLKR
jgi:hypothetical protein